MSGKNPNRKHLCEIPSSLAPHVISLQKWKKKKSSAEAGKGDPDAGAPPPSSSEMPWSGAWLRPLSPAVSAPPPPPGCSGCACGVSDTLSPQHAQ